MNTHIFTILRSLYMIESLLWPGRLLLQNLQLTLPFFPWVALTLGKIPNKISTNLPEANCVCTGIWPNVSPEFPWKRGKSLGYNHLCLYSALMGILGAFHIQGTCYGLVAPPRSQWKGTLDSFCSVCVQTAASHLMNLEQWQGNDYKEAQTTA